MAVTFMKPLTMARKSVEKDVVIAAELSKNAINTNIWELKKNNAVEIDVLTENGEYIAKSDAGDDSRNYKKIELVSDVTGWIYRAYIPMGVFNRQEHILLIMALVAVILATANGALAIWYSLRKN